MKLHHLLALSFLIASTCSFDAQAIVSTDGMDPSLHKANSALKEFASAQAKQQANAMPNRWLEIPAWLAGCWCSIYELRLYPEQELPKEKSNRVDLQLTAVSKIGMAKDGRGRIWQYAGAPISDVSEVGDLIKKQSLLQYDIVTQKNNVVEIKTTLALEDRDSKTGNIVGSIIEKSSVTYTYVAPKKILITVDLSDYDPQGVLVEHYRNSCAAVRILAFEREDLGDLQPLFDKFVGHLKYAGK